MTLKSTSCLSLETIAYIHRQKLNFNMARMHSLSPKAANHSDYLLSAQKLVISLTAFIFLILILGKLNQWRKGLTNAMGICGSRVHGRLSSAIRIKVPCIHSSWDQSDTDAF